MDKKKAAIQIAKSTSRDNKMFKSMENSPQYEYNFEVNKKKLNSHIVPF